MKNEKRRTSHSSVLLSEPAPDGCPGEKEAARYPDHREQDIRKVIKLMEDEASGARDVLAREKGSMCMEAITGFESRADALEQYASMLVQALPESAPEGGAGPGNAQADARQTGASDD